MKSLQKYLALLFLFSAMCIKLTPAQTGELFVFAGNDTIVCLTTDSIEVFGYAENYHFVAWEKTGDGFFYDEESLKTAYIPGPLDIENRHTTLYLVGIANEPFYTIMVDSIHITIELPPMTYAGPDATICEGEIHQLNGCAQHFIEMYWQTTGDGTFDDSHSIAPQYTPGNNDILNGETTLTLIAQPNAPCSETITDDMQLTISRAPYLDAGNDTTICLGSNYQLSAEAAFYDDLIWSTYGDGTFCNNAITNPVYYPGPNDVNNGQVQIIILIAPYTACGLDLIDSLNLSIQPLPDVNAGNDRSICEPDNVLCAAFAENYSTLQWMVFGGNGYFDDPTDLNTTYHPGNQELANGLFYINLMVVPVEPCLMPVNSLFQVDVIGQPELNAGENMTICNGEAILIEADGENYASLQWHTSGDGTFENDTLPVSYYHPGTADLTSQITQLWITANGIAPCVAQVSDTLTIHSSAIENVNSEITNEVMALGDSLNLFFEVQTPNSGYYQWYLNGSKIENQNAPMLIIDSILPQQAGNYHCIFEHDCGMVASDTALITVYVESQQSIILAAGWNGVSSYIFPSNNNMETVLSPIINDVIILFNEDGVYSPYMDLMTIYEWEPRTGYITKTNTTDTLIISGYIEYPVPPINIASGWSLFSSGCSCNLNVENLFSSYPKISIIKEIGGMGIYWPAHGINTLINIKPGKAYHILNSSSEELVIPFPGFNN
jgi:hypothetical protein